MNSSNSYDRLLQVEEQNYEVEIEKVDFLFFFVISSPEATVHSDQRHCLPVYLFTRGSFALSDDNAALALN